MIELPVYNREGQQVDTFPLDEQTLGGEVRFALLKQAYVMQHANRRQGSARTKARSEVEALEEQPFSDEKMLALRNIHFETEDALYATLSCEQREGLRQLKRAHHAERMNAHWQRNHDQNR